MTMAKIKWEREGNRWYGIDLDGGFHLIERNERGIYDPLTADLDERKLLPIGLPTLKQAKAFCESEMEDTNNGEV